VALIAATAVGRAGAPAQAALQTVYQNFLIGDIQYQPAGLVAQADGQVWVAYPTAAAVRRYDPADPTSPNAEIDNLGDPGALTLDPSGDLWVADPGAGTVREFMPSVWADGNGWDTDAAVTITGLASPVALGSDSYGDLWIADAGSDTSTLYVFTALTLQTAQQGTTSIAATDANGTLDVAGQVRALAVTADGQPWAATADTVYGWFQPESGDAPNREISGFTSTPAAMDFDPDGNLYVATASPAGGEVDRFDQAGLAASTPAQPLAADQGTEAVSGPPNPSALAWGSGGLWLDSSDSHAAFIPTATIDQGGASFDSATVALDTGFFSPTTVAAAPNGDLWVADARDGSSSSYTVSRFTSLMTGRPVLTPAAAATTLGSAPDILTRPSLAFNTAGDLWVTDGAAKSVLRYSASTIAASSTLTLGAPTQAITGFAGGTLLVATRGDELYVYDKAAGAIDEFQDTAGATTTADATGRTEVHLPISGMAVDAAGAIWTASGTDVTNQYGTGANPWLVFRGFSADAGDYDETLTFDQAGNLWVADTLQNAVVRIDATAFSTAAQGQQPSADAVTRLEWMDAPGGAAVDTSGRVWTAAASGLWRATPRVATTTPTATPAATVTTTVPGPTTTVTTPGPTTTVTTPGPTTTVTTPGPTDTVTTPGPTVTVTTPGPTTTVAGPSVTTTATHTITAPAPAVTITVPDAATPSSISPNTGAAAPYVYVNPKVAQRVAAAQRSLVLPRGRSMVLAAYGYTATGKRIHVRWRSSNQHVATVIKSGRITARQDGRATIYASAGALSWKVKLTVRARSAAVHRVAGVHVTGLTATTLRVGQNLWLTASASPGTATSAKITFKSSRPSVLLIDKAGHLEARSPGTVNLRIRASGVKNAKSKVYRITVTP
jgi:streptogramin lyase